MRAIFCWENNLIKNLWLSAFVMVEELCFCFLFLLLCVFCWPGVDESNFRVLDQ